MGLLTIRETLRDCKQLSIYMKHLGFDVTTEKKHISAVMSDRRMVEFLLDARLDGHGMLSEHLKDLGMMIHPGGDITATFGADHEKNR